MNERDRTRRLILSAMIAGFLARALFAFVYWQDRPLTIDQTEYLLLAERVLQGDGLTYPPGERRLMRSPGYPIFLAAVGAVAPGQGPIKLAQCLLGVVAILQIAVLARRLGGDRAAVLASWLAALYPPLAFEPAYVLSEPLYTVLALSAVTCAWNATSATDNGTLFRWSALTGALSGAVLLVRPEFAIFVGLLGLWLLWRQRIVAAAMVGVTTALVVAPWPLYNAIAHDRVILLSSRGGPNFWMGNNELAMGDGDVASIPPMAAEYVSLISENPDLA
ncbi:MAG: glycosyltransferase family 39 protein, partial [Vicinamibacterales bacterium]